MNGLRTGSLVPHSIKQCCSLFLPQEHLGKLFTLKRILKTKNKILAVSVNTAVQTCPVM